MILLREVVKAYPGAARLVVDHLSLTVPEHTTTVLLGSSGCGKTTVLRMIARLLEPTAGIIEVDGRDVAMQTPEELRAKLGFVFQHHALYPHLTVTENICLPMRLAGVPLKERQARGDDLLAAVGLNPLTFRHRYPHALSGGQRQRVSVARALALQPAYLLLDEPFSSLDHLTRCTLHEELRRIRDSFGVTILLVTHDIFEAVALGDQIAVMNEGRIEQAGTAETILDAPATAFVRDLVSRPFHDMLAVARHRVHP